MTERPFVIIPIKTVAQKWSEKQALYSQCLVCIQRHLPWSKESRRKSNEIKAIPELIKALDLENCIITIDAMGCQKSITKLIIENKADYILCAKDNHETLRDMIEFNLSEETRYYLCHAKGTLRKTKGMEEVNTGNVYA